MESGRKAIRYILVRAFLIASVLLMVLAIRQLADGASNSVLLFFLPELFDNPRSEADSRRRRRNPNLAEAETETWRRRSYFTAGGS